MMDIFLELNSLNYLWFQKHKYLSNEEMLQKGLIDLCDLVWINRFRENEEKIR